jgi:hypothetical protein
MRSKFSLILIAAIILSSCKKEKPITVVPPKPPAEEPPIVQTFLKDIIVPDVPSPYYHFEYDAAGKVSLVSFAAGFGVYNIIYNGNKITEMRNTGAANRDTLKYSYDNDGRVNMVTYTDLAGEIYVKVYLTYDGHKLIKLERERRTGGAFVFNKILSMSYYADGNLKDLKYHFPITPNNPTAFTYTDHFEQYDNKINSDGFDLLHSEFFDDVLLLPEVQLQRNNPGKETRTGEVTNHEVNYTYTYNNQNLPLTKTGDMTILTGPGTGQRFQTQAVFSYY